MPWQAPKTNWTGTDGVTSADLNRIEENTRVLSTASNLYVQGTLVSGNTYDLAFANPPTVALGFSCTVRFLAANTARKTGVYVRINGTTYPVRLNWNDPNPYGIPYNYINTSLIYTITYDNNQFILKDAQNSFDPITGGRTFFVGNSSTSDFNTIQEAIVAMRKVAAGARTILILNRNANPTTTSDYYTENVTIQDFHGAPIIIRAERNVVIDGQVTIQNNTAEVLFQGDSAGPLSVRSSDVRPQNYVSAFNNYKLSFINFQVQGWNNSITTYNYAISRCIYVYFYMAGGFGAATSVLGDECRFTFNNYECSNCVRRLDMMKSVSVGGAWSGNTTNDRYSNSLSAI
ncbi:hypothetical protein D3C75_410200 [compost metagenome]